MCEPKLRFPEFSGEWEKKKINELFEFLPTNSFSRANLNYEKGKVKNIHYGDIHTKFPTNLDCGKVEIPFINPEIDLSKIKPESYCENGDLIIADASEDYNDIGKTIELSNVNNQKLLAGLHTFLARDLSGLTVCGYRGYMLLNEDIKLQIKKIATGISVLGISKTNLGELNIKIPSIPEQEKIASFISQVDEKIGFLEKKLDLWETYKKGIMQKIFSQELRFKNGTGDDYPDWEERKLKNYVERVNRKNKDLESNLPLTISAEHGLVDQKIFFNKIVASKSLKNYYLIKNGEFAYNKSYSNGFPWGVIKRLDKYDKGALSTLYICFSLKEGIDSDFLVQYFLSSNWHKEVSLIAVEGARNHGLLNIGIEDFFNTRHIIPSIHEQMKIAKILTEIDIKIELINKEIEFNKEFKKGLLQKMFC